MTGTKVETSGEETNGSVEAKADVKKPDKSQGSPLFNVGLRVAGVNLFEPLDMACWLLVFLFFSISAILTDGNLTMSFIGAAGIVVVMLFVGASIEVIIEALMDVKGLGTLVGFITNGPEALCLIVGLVVGDILFAASTPLGSNFMNPVMLFTAALLTGSLALTVRNRPVYIAVCTGTTACLAGIFFFIPQWAYAIWLGVTILASAALFFLRPPEIDIREMDAVSISRVWLIPALIVLVAAGYLLDPVVSFTAEHSRAPKGVIGFFVLSTLTSWPEFKSTLSLLRRGRPMAAVLNITVSNITNLWLACVGIIVFLFQ